MLADLAFKEEDPRKEETEQARSPGETVQFDARRLGMDGTIRSGNEGWSEAHESALLKEDDPFVLMGGSFEELSSRQDQQMEAIHEMKQQLSALMQMMTDDRKNTTKSNRS
jgi:hypothetical protein